MPPHKQPLSTKKNVEEADPLTNPAPRWKWVALSFIFLIIVGTGVWSTGIIQNALAGPRIPLPRQSTGFTLGMSENQVLQEYPGIKKSIREFNDDPLFHIVTLTPQNGLTDASSVDLLFYKNQLYFISTMWEGPKAQTIPIKDWAHEYRRWDPQGADTEPLSDQVLLVEWHFADSQTEMTLRNLSYPDHIQRWQDLRDDSNSAAQSAFAKYRLDTAG